MTLVIAGLGIGLAAGLLLTRFLSTLLFRVDPRDPLIFGVSAAALVAVSIFACWLPARRAANVDPLTALRNE
jgi:ABC-type antimicrobial peptide transport system permease subunit